MEIPGEKIPSLWKLIRGKHKPREVVEIRFVFPLDRHFQPVKAVGKPFIRFSGKNTVTEGEGIDWARALWGDLRNNVS